MINFKDGYKLRMKYNPNSIKGLKGLRDNELFPLYNKYLKYKQKYLNLQKGGALEEEKSPEELEKDKALRVSTLNSFSTCNEIIKSIMNYDR